MKNINTYHEYLLVFNIIIIMFMIFYQSIALKINNNITYNYSLESFFLDFIFYFFIVK